MKQFTIILIGLLVNHFVQAQTIDGKLVKQSDKSALEMMSIALCQATDSTVLNGTSTNSQGYFCINNVKKGRYNLLIRNIGYQTFTTAVFDFDGQSTKTMNPIELEPSQTALKEVIIKDKNIRIKELTDKTVYYLPDSILNNSQQVADAIASIPAITYNRIKKNFTVRGKEKILVLVDDKERDMDYVNQLPPEAIDKIEVQYVPSLRYEGYDYVINVILNRNKIQGYGGSILAYGSKSYSGSQTYLKTKLRYSAPKFSVLISATNSTGNWERNIESEDNFRYKSILYKNRYSVAGDNQDIKPTIDFDWYINKKNIINFYIDLMPQQKTEYTALKENENIIEGKQTVFNSLTRSKSDNTSSFYSIYYKRKFDKEGRELNLDANYYNCLFANTLQYNKQYELVEDKPFSSQYLNQILTKDNRKSYYYKLNYSDNLTKNLSIYAGGSFSNMLYHNTISNPTTASSDYYTLQYSGYAGTKFKVEKFSTHLAATQNRLQCEVNNETKNPTYNLKLILDFGYSFSDSHSLKLSYNRAFNNPSMWNINPFRVSLDSLHVNYTNFDAQPYVSHELRLSHYIECKGFTINSELFYRKADKEINNVVFLEDKEIVNYSLNTKLNYNYGLSLNLSYKKDKLNLILNGTYQQTYHRGLIDYRSPTTNRSSFNSYFEVDYQYSKWYFTGYCIYNYPSSIDFQYTFYKTADYAVLVGYNFSKNMELNIVYNLPFSGYFKLKQILETPDYSSKTLTRCRQEGVFMTFFYSFSKGENQRKLNRDIQKE